MSRQSERKQLQHFEIFTLSENWVNFNARQGESVPISMKNHLIGVASQVQNGDGNGQEKRAQMKDEGGRRGKEEERGKGREGVCRGRRRLGNFLPSQFNYERS